MSRRPPVRSPTAPDTPSEGPGSRQQTIGFWLYTLHLATVWGLALSNVFEGLTLLWTGVSWRSVRQRWTELDRTAASRVLRPFAFYVLVLTVSVFTSLEVKKSMWELRGLVGLTTLPLAMIWIRGESAVRRIIDLLIWITALMALYGIGQYLFTDYGGLQSRIPGPFGHYMTYSGVLLIGACLAIGRLMTATGSRRPLDWAIVLVILLTLGLTLTRSAWLAAFVILTAAFLIRFRRWLWVYGTTVVLVLALTASLAPQHWSRLTSMVSLEDVSNYDRICMAEAGLHMISDRPLFGIGPGMVHEYYPIYRHPTAHRTDVKHLHNTLLQLAAESGLLSVVGYVWLMAAVFMLAYRRYRDEGGLAGERADLYLGVLFALIALNVAGVFEANWRDTEIERWILFLMALPVCLELDPVGEPESASTPTVQ